MAVLVFQACSSECKAPPVLGVVKDRMEWGRGGGQGRRRGRGGGCPVSPFEEVNLQES